MQPSALLLLVAFRHRIEESDLESGLQRVATIAGRDVQPNAFYSVLADAIANGYIHDPIRLRPGSLQCHWRLELTLCGVHQVLSLLREHNKTSDALLAETGTPGQPSRDGIGNV